MAIIAKNNSKPKELIPAGNYIARCYQMIELGTAEELYMGKPKVTTKIRIGWELPTELKVFKEEKGPQPLVISKGYTLGMGEKYNLRKDLESWRGKGFTKEEANAFDVTKLLGVPCMLNIIHQPSEEDPTILKERISSITPLPNGFECPSPINPKFVLSFDDFDELKLEELPDFIKERVRKSNEYKNLQSPNNSQAATKQSEVETTQTADDLPF
jgi:hypothetical protein